jgi:hypothetical protein
VISGREPAVQGANRPVLLRFTGSANRRCSKPTLLLTIASRRSFVAELLRRETGSVRVHFGCVRPVRLSDGELTAWHGPKPARRRPGVAFSSRWHLLAAACSGSPTGFSDEAASKSTITAKAPTTNPCSVMSVGATTPKTPITACPSVIEPTTIVHRPEPYEPDYNTISQLVHDSAAVVLRTLEGSPPPPGLARSG